MRPDAHRGRCGRRAALLAVLVAALRLAACGGGDAPAESDPFAGLPPLRDGESALVDAQVYSSAGSASLAGAQEAVAVTKHRLVLGGRALDYTARAGHLIARHPASGAAEASVFHVAYTVDGADPATRPVTFFYNGGPGSASVWLHLGSFGPKRLVTGVPSTAATAPFPLVDNAESLLDASDLVFLDAVGTGRSQAIAPYRNRDFWGVDADAALFRDAVQRWRAAHGRTASPFFLFGESYGGPRTAVLARLLQEAGAPPAGLVLQSPALDYHSNCSVAGAGSCAAFLPAYGAVGAFHGRAAAAFEPLNDYLVLLRDVTARRYAPALADWAAGGAIPADLPPLLAGYTGLDARWWNASFNLGPGAFRTRLLDGRLLGRYDGRMAAATGSALAAEGDPSGTAIAPSFAAAIDRHLRETLRYANASTYVVTGSAIGSWDFSHAGRPLPDTVPDLAAALAQDPALRVHVHNGVHDLATPFHVTEQDLARLGAGARVRVLNVDGGHMSYLDDASRQRQKADLLDLLAAAPAPAPAAARRVPQAAARAWPDRAGRLPAASVPPGPREPALQSPMRDPWVPPR